MRKLRRSIAKAEMQRAGIPKLCKKHDSLGNKCRSTFAMNWRKFIGLLPINAALTKRRRIFGRKKGRAYA